MELSFRQANTADISQIWEILQGAIQRRKEAGSRQWQDGYPNSEIVAADIARKAGFVLTVNHSVAGYCAIFINDEPVYASIAGAWLTDGSFVAYHRVAISNEYLGKGLGLVLLKNIEDFALANNIISVRADTNFDNPIMLRLFEKLGYQYCGEVIFRGGTRKAFEKVITV
ncbi:GNAT family N-acetyltransferase [Flavobacterium sp. RHBU_24]|uniref:GNAT family N-acetyltransferase n=1 Tax=Flavobacterium sp. RHBU_24 TaxID=3391185 RepID=UPI0039849B47